MELKFTFKHQYMELKEAVRANDVAQESVKEKQEERTQVFQYTGQISSRSSLRKVKRIVR